MRSVSIGLYHVCAVLDNRVMKCYGSPPQSHAALVMGLGHYHSNHLSPLTTPDFNFGTEGRYAVSVSVNTPHTLNDPILGKQQGGDRFIHLIHTCVVLDNKAVRCWGHGAQGQLGTGILNNHWNVYPNPNFLAPDVNFTNAYAGRILGGGNPGPGSTSSVQAVVVSTGGTHSCTVLTDGRLFCWGSKHYGALGTGRETWTGAGGGAGAGVGSQALPTEVHLGRDEGRRAVSVSCGVEHTCVIVEQTVEPLRAGLLFCFGYVLLGFMQFTSLIHLLYHSLLNKLNNFSQIKLPGYIIYDNTRIQK